MPRVDLHTHSIASPDGGLTLQDYRSMLESGRLDAVAITDHNRIDFALNARAEIGNAIIVGEEITAREGEIVGLYLNEPVPAGLSALETAELIRGQGGLVYIPHPFETARKGLLKTTLDEIAAYIDIVETHNGRTLQNRGRQAGEWATAHKLPGASSSDAHGQRGWGNTASELEQLPTRETLAALLDGATLNTASTGFVGRLYPKLNRVRQWRHHV